MKKFIYFAVVALCMGFTMASCNNDNNDNKKDEETYKKDLGGGVYEVNSQRFIDLGLPSGLLWAQANLGATAEAETGDYFAWGETAAKTSFTLDNYKWSTYSKYNKTDKITTLEKSDDAATVLWKEPIRMPSKDEFDELYDNCTWDIATRTNAAGEKVTGIEGKSKKNSNTIFFPFAGYIIEDTKWDLNNFGQYWTSSLFTNNTSITEDVAFYHTFAEQVKHEWSSKDRYNGRSIRAVVK